MIPLYEEKKESLRLIHKTSKHVPPHLHNTIEFVYVTEGSLELGIAQQLYHMEQGDFAIVFPEVIHHYQVFSSEKSRAIYISALPALGGPFQSDMQKYCPENPVIKASKIHNDVLNAIETLRKERAKDSVVAQAYVQIMLARSMPKFKLIEKTNLGSSDIVYRTVYYIAGHFKEEITLDKMAKELGVSKYVLSRVFSSTFHRNFNQYVNEQRLHYACTLLEGTNEPITEICLEAGFQSQRTFHRAFREKYRMTPREYRTVYKQKRLP